MIHIQARLKKWSHNKVACHGAHVDAVADGHGGEGVVQASARALHFSSSRTFFTEIVNQQCHQQSPNKRAMENLNKGIN